MSEIRKGTTVKSLCSNISTQLLRDFNYALVWGTSAKHSPQRCGLSHRLDDEDVVQISAKTAEEQRHDKNYGQKVQAYYDNYHEKKKKKPKLKT